MIAVRQCGWLRCESDRLMCFEIENQQQYQQRKNNNNSNNKNNNNAKDEHPKEMKTSNGNSNSNIVITTCRIQFYYIRAPWRWICRACTYIVFRSLPQTQAIFLFHPDDRVPRSLTKCASELPKRVLLSVYLVITMMLRHIHSGTLNNYRLTDSIIQTTWNAEIASFSSKRGRQHMFNARFSLDWMIRISFCYIFEIETGDRNCFRAIYACMECKEAERSQSDEISRTLISFIGHHQSHKILLIRTQFGKMKSTTINIVGHDLRLIYLLTRLYSHPHMHANWIGKKTSEILLKNFENLSINGLKLDTVFCAFSYLVLANLQIRNLLIDLVFFFFINIWQKVNLNVRLFYSRSTIIKSAKNHKVGLPKKRCLLCYPCGLVW